MAKEITKPEEKQIKSGRIKSRVNYDVTVQYDGRDCVVAPRQEIPIPDFSKLGAFNPREILKIEG
uniref:Uncharacterized protein n=1 Tax=Siphoviridae sp. ctYh54 TaxID=2826379 RepID=A0A8S5ME22_9CAUD|nr:MAG TPA: hypothetical protein [Siphoviridae sp. ctYh54]